MISNTSEESQITNVNNSIVTLIMRTIEIYNLQTAIYMDLTTNGRQGFLFFVNYYSSETRVLQYIFWFSQAPNL